ncbi:hypothetical protein C8T65DRAFT_632612 [Cerioporus squamosus]|nr:hypothetical protein C8T65DRAFT_632612 [Cerioporus squamosus]
MCVDSLGDAEVVRNLWSIKVNGNKEVITESLVKCSFLRVIDRRYAADSGTRRTRTAALLSHSRPGLACKPASSAHLIRGSHTYSPPRMRASPSGNGCQIVAESIHLCQSQGFPAARQPVRAVRRMILDAFRGGQSECRSWHGMRCVKTLQVYHNRDGRRVLTGRSTRRGRSECGLCGSRGRVQCAVARPSAPRFLCVAATWGDNPPQLRVSQGSWPTQSNTSPSQGCRLEADAVEGYAGREVASVGSEYRRDGCGQRSAILAVQPPPNPGILLMS